MPYFDGDFWPTMTSNVLKEMKTEGGDASGGKKGKKATKTAVKSKIARKASKVQSCSVTVVEYA